MTSSIAPASAAAPEGFRLPELTLLVTGREYAFEGGRGTGEPVWWDHYRLVPGEYELTWTDPRGRAVAEGQRPYAANVTVPATLVDRYTDAGREQLDRVQAIHLHIPAHKAVPGSKQLGGCAEVRTASWVG